MRYGVRFVLWALLIVALVFPSGCGPQPAGPTSSSASLAGPNILTVSYIDIGQGDSELIQIPGDHTILVDSGPPEGRQSLMDYLDKAGVRRFDMVIATHPHEDHIGNMPEVLDKYPVGEFVDSTFNYGSQTQMRMLQAIKDKNIKFVSAPRDLLGKTVQVGDASLHFVQPQLQLLHGTDSDPNNSSVVFLMTYGKIRFLFPGDMEEAERSRLYDRNEDLHADIYKAAHHGSHNGTDDQFMRLVQPKVAVISCGVDNDYGHPHKEALDALARIGAQVYRTDQQGTIVVTSDGNTYHVAALGKQPDAPPPGHGHSVSGASYHSRRTRRSYEPPAPYETATPAPNKSAPSVPNGTATPATNGTDTSGLFIGNIRTHIYHTPGSDGRLPAPANRVYFHSAAEAEAAGYRVARE